MDEVKGVVQIEDERPEWRWWTRIPNIILEKVLDPYEFKLYFVIKKIAQDDGTCWLTTENLADMAGMSVGKVSEARKELEKKGLIRCEMRKPINTKTGKPSRGRPCYHITIVDIWEENERRWQEIRGQGISSPDEENEDISSRDERFPSPRERYPSPDEATKNLRKKNPNKKDRDVYTDEQVFNYLRDKGMREPYLTKISGERDLSWCEGAFAEAGGNPGGVVNLYQRGWQPGMPGFSNKGKNQCSEDRYKYVKGVYADHVEH